MKVALVYDRVNKWGGAERVLLALHQIWPEAPLYTSVYNPQTAPWAKVFKVIPSFLQKFPGAKTNHEFYAALMPLAFESFNFDGYDVVISVTSEAAKGIITKPKTLHLCYCLTPTRYLWSGYEEYFGKRWLRLLISPMTISLRNWDKVAAQRPDEYIAISKTVQERIKRYYGWESEVVYPPIDTEKFHPPAGGLNSKSQSFDTAQDKNTKYFLVVSRLVKYKKVDLAVEAFNELGWELRIVGGGREMRGLRERARENIKFLGHLTDEALLDYYQNCQAVIFPQEEDFGIVPLEALACGKPVVAFRAGGATETIVEGKTGLFFYPQAKEALKETIEKLVTHRFKNKECRRQAEKFNQERFAREFENLVEKKWKEHLKTTFTF
jgi:glycosyltransferase involved in cell wall biosynthesis